jgi:hypothetical protein
MFLIPAIVSCEAKEEKCQLGRAIVGQKEKNFGQNKVTNERRPVEGKCPDARGRCVRPGRKSEQREIEVILINAQNGS